jgi:hypothetical protein
MHGNPVREVPAFKQGALHAKSRDGAVAVMGACTILGT